jgi:hypothetical protein
MAQHYSDTMAPYGELPPGFPNGALAAGRVRAYTSVVTLAGQASGDTIVIARVPASSAFLYGVLNTDTSTDTATLAIGVAGTPAKYKVAAAHTETNAPAIFGLNAAAAVPLERDEEVIITVGTAALPASGRLVVTLFFANA